MTPVIKLHLLKSNLGQERHLSFPGSVGRRRRSQFCETGPATYLSALTVRRRTCTSPGTPGRKSSRSSRTPPGTICRPQCTRSSHSSSGCALPKQPSHHGDSSTPSAGFQCSFATRSAFLRMSRTEISCTGSDRARTSPGSTRIFSEYFRARSSSLARWSSSVAAARLRSFSAACASPACRAVRFPIWRSRSR